MNIIEAVSKLENGKKIKRKRWENIALISYTSYAFIMTIECAECGKEYEYDYDLYIYDLVLKDDVFPLIKYQFNVTDILADDWEAME
jgi:hypothetical protein